MKRRPAAARPAAGSPRLLDEHLLGLAPMAVILMDDLGTVTHWSSSAGEIFGLAAEHVVGRPLRTLLRLPQEHRDAFEPRGGPRIRHVWTGTFLVPRADDGLAREIAWWVYPLTGPDRVRVLAFAADAQRLRDGGPGLALGEVLLTAPTPAPFPSDSGVRMIRLEPTLIPPSAAASPTLDRRLAEMLPAMPPGAAEPIIRQVLTRGFPALDLSVTARLPIAAYDGPPPPPEQLIREVETPRPDPVPVRSMERSAAQDRLDFLSDVSSRIVDTLDPKQTAAALCTALVPRFADFADVQLFESIVSEQELPPLAPDESPMTVRVAVSHNDTYGRWDDVVPRGETVRLPKTTPFTHSIITGQTVAVPRIGERYARRISELAGRDFRPLLQGRALLVSPLIARGTALGILTLLRRSDRPAFDALDVAMVEDLCRRTAVCVDNGRLYQRESRAVAELQKTMLPDAPPVVAGSQICYRYVPASEAVRVGGDWFDAIPLPGNRLAMVVGDVMGHGLNSAAIMGQFRTAVRTLAGQDLPPGQLLRRLDDLARRLGDEYIATCIYAVYDPIARRCQLANAGHPPPVLVSPSGESNLLDVPSGAPIGVGGIAFETVEFEVEDDSQFVLCTDGLVERRGQGIDVGLAALREYLSGPPQPLERVCETLIDNFGAHGRREDDIALLAVRFTGIPKEDVVTWTLDALPTRVREARVLARDTLVAWGLAELSDTVELLVSELVTNAVRHGAGDIGLRMIRAGSLLCEVRDDGHDLPNLRGSDLMAETGRGLQLVTALAERWGAQRTDTGKVVWFEQSLP